MALSSLGLLVLVGGCSAFIFSPPETWDGLKVTWSYNFVSPNSFLELPRTANEAKKQMWDKKSDCDTTANYRGVRYTRYGDNSLILLYDVNGYIAGIQTMVPENQPGGYPHGNIQPPFIKEGANYVLTAYFVDPATICTTGRSKADFDKEGTGNSLYIQNGTVAEKHSILIPSKQDDIKNTMWTEGKCFYTMGKHYWYDTSADMSCDDFFPVFVLYNSGKLNAFGWAMGADLPSPHLEHPGSSVLDLFFNEVPKCLSQFPKLSTMHIYLTDSATRDNC